MEAGRLPHWAAISPLRLAIVLVVIAIGYGLMVWPFASDLQRDRRLAGTWQPAYDMRAIEGRCTVYQLLVSVCDVQIGSIAEPQRPPMTMRTLMAFSGGSGQAMVPVRSTLDPTALSIAYLADTKLTNRTLTFVAATITCLVMFLAIFGLLLKGQYAGGSAERALSAGLDEMRRRHEPARAAGGVNG